MANLSHDVAFIEGFAAVGVAVHGDENPRLDLGKTVGHAGCPKIGRATRPHGPDRHSGQHRHHGMGRIGQKRCHPVAGQNTAVAEKLGERSRLAFEFCPTHFGQSVALALENNGGAGIGFLPKNMLGVVERCAFKPFEIRHLIARQHLCVGYMVLDFEVFPEAFPEVGDLFGAPFPERMVILELQVFFSRQPLGVAGEIAIAQEGGRRLPEEFGGRSGCGGHSIVAKRLLFRNSNL